MLILGVALIWLSSDSCKWRRSNILTMSQINHTGTIPSVLLPDNILQSGGLESDDLSLRQALRILRKRKYTILCLGLSCGLLAFMVSALLRPYYRTTALIEIESQQANPLDGVLGQLASGIGGTDDVKTEVQTQVSVLQSDALGIETMKRTHFEDHQQTRSPLLGTMHSYPREKGGTLYDTPAIRESLLNSLHTRLVITPVPDSRLLQLTFEDPDPRYAAFLTNTLIDQYVQDRLARRNASTAQASEWMTTQIADLNKQVDAAQQRLIDYQRQSGVAVYTNAPSTLPSQGGGQAPLAMSPVLDRLMQLNKDLVIAQEVRITRGAVYELAKAGDASALISMSQAQPATAPSDTAPAGTSVDGLLSLRQQQLALKVRISSALQTYGAMNPHLIELEKELAELDRQVQEELGRIVKSAEGAYEMAKSTEAGIQKAYDAEEREANDANDSVIHMAVLQQQADSTRQLYQDLYTKLQESKLSVGTQSSNVSLISNALPSSTPVHPRKLLNAGLGFGGGLFLGMILAFVRDNLDDSIVNSTQVEELTGVPVLGLIPRFSPSPRALARPGPNQAGGLPPSNSGAWVTKQPTSQAAEAYRALRTTLLLSHAGSPPRTILVTSSLPKDGKSTTTYNLAACFAALGTRVLAVDADLRNPTLHRLSGISNARGLANLLTSSVDLHDMVQQDPLAEHLHILPSGPTPPNPAELLGSGVFAKLIVQLSKEYDLVMIDSPPIMLVADSSIVAAMVDGVIAVVKSQSTTRPALVRAADLFRRHRVNLLGIVLNAVDVKSSEYYYSYGYYGGDYYGDKTHAQQES